MKNRESTTLAHYNLLSNRRHAISIAMNLYSSFSGIEVKDRDKMANDIKCTTNKEQLINWFKEKDTDLTKSELADIEKTLHQLTLKEFYGNSAEVRICLHCNIYHFKRFPILKYFT